MKRPLATATAALALTVLPAATAYADPTDPAPGWPSLYSSGGTLAKMTGDGGAHTASADDFDTPMTMRAYGPDGQLRTVGPDYGYPYITTGGLDYGVVVDRSSSSIWGRTYFEGSWGDRVKIADQPNGVSYRIGVDSNAHGDTITTWMDDDGQFHAGRLMRNDAWRVSTPPVVDPTAGGSPYRFRVSDPVINQLGKTSLVWFVPGTKGGRLMRSVLEAGSTRWSTAQQIAVLDSVPAKLELTSDWDGRETVAAGSLVWRQVHSNSGFRFLFRAVGATSVDLDASGPRTRAAWMTRSGHTFRVKSRMVFESELRPTTKVWTKAMDKKWRAGCFAKAGTLVGVSPQGRSYLAWGVHSPYGLAGCPDSGGGVVARVAALNGANKTVGTRTIDYLRGQIHTLSVNGRGPVALSYIRNYDDNGWGEESLSIFLTR